MHAPRARTARGWREADAAMTRRARGPAWIAARLAAARRHSMRTWLLWAVGTAAALTVSFALADPGLLMLALDPELIALIVLSSIALIRISAPGLLLSGCAATLVRGASTVAAKLTGRGDPTQPGLRVQCGPRAVADKLFARQCGLGVSGVIRWVWVRTADARQVTPGCPVRATAAVSRWRATISRSIAVSWWPRSLRRTSN